MKKALSLICTLAIVLGMVIPTAYAETNSPCLVCGTDEWTTLTADTVLEDGGHYRLSGTVSLSKQFSVSTTANVCIDLAGHTLKHDTGRAFLLGNSDGKGNDKVVLNVFDSSENGTGRVEGDSSDAASGGVAYLYNGATINIYGGTFASAETDANTAKIGGIFQLRGGATLNMYGGKIIGGHAIQDGGAVYVYKDATLNMEGGIIEGGTAGTSGNCVYAMGSSKIKLTNDASIEEIYFAGDPANSLIISATYWGSVVLNPKTALTEGATIATTQDAAVIGEDAKIVVKGTEFVAAISGNKVVVSTGAWCEACQKAAVWQDLSGQLSATASGHYKLTKNVSTSGVTLKCTSNVCLDLNGFTYNSSGRAFLLGNSSGAYTFALNILDSSAEQTGVLSGAGGDGYTAGVVYVYKNTALNLYSGTICLSKGGSGNQGGVLATWSGSEINMYGGKIIGGKANDFGGAIYLRSGSTLNLAGGSIEGGTATNKGDCVYVASGGTIKLSGNGSADQIYYDGDSASKLTVSGKYTGKVELKFATTPAAGKDVGNSDNAEILKENITIAGTTMCAAISGSDLVTTNLVGASVTDGEGNVTYYDTLAAAVVAAGKGDTIKLLADNSENVTIENAILDLFGWDLKGNINGSALYIKDSATDDFTVEDAKGYGVVSGTVTGDVTYADGYLPLEETNGTSYHKYILKLSKVSLRPGNSGLYYTGNILVDEAVLAKIDRYGIAVSTQSKNPVADGTDAASRYTAYTKEQYGKTDAVSVLISNIMDGEATDAVNAATAIYGCPYILFDDGNYFYGKTVAANMQQVAEAADKQVGSMKLPQFRALSEMYKTYKATISAWNVPKMNANAQAGETAANDRVLKVLVVGNSHGLDATNLLYEVFKAEGLPAEYDDLVLGAMYTGGCSVSSHANKALNTLPYDYYTKNDGKKADGSWTKYYDDQATLKHALEDENWDVVLLQEMNTSSARSEYFENDNIETVFNFVANKLGYEPYFMWNMIWANPEIPESYVNYLYSEGDDGSGGDVGSGAEGDDNDTSEPAVIARRLAWIFQTQQPGALELWGKNYVKLWENNRQVMYNNIVSNVHNYVVAKKVHNIGMDDVMPNATAIQYAIEWMGMHEQDMYRDYTHVSDLGRLTVAYLYYAKLTGKTSIDAPKYTLVSQTMENARQPLGYARDYSVYSDVIKNSVNFALADPYGVIQNYTYAEYLALTADEQAAYKASFDSFSVHSGWTYEKWLEQAVANVTYTDYIRMTDAQKATFEELCPNFTAWYESVVKNLRFAEYFLLSAEEAYAYQQQRSDDGWYKKMVQGFTYTDYVMYTYEQQQEIAFFFNSSFSGHVPGTFDERYSDWLKNMTYEEFMSLPMHQKLQYRKTYKNIDAFLVWYNDAKENAGK